MLNVTLIKGEREFDFAAEGHCGAERNANGSDLVCAAASMLVSMLTTRFERLRPSFEELDISCEHGQVFIYGSIAASSASAARAIFGFLDAVMFGFYILCESYPVNVRVEEKKC